jgi:hypothetical protein
LLYFYFFSAIFFCMYFHFNTFLLIIFLLSHSSIKPKKILFLVLYFSFLVFLCIFLHICAEICYLFTHPANFS